MKICAFRNVPSVVYVTIKVIDFYLFLNIFHLLILLQNPMSGTPVPEGLPLQPTLPATSAVPELNPFQKPSKMVSKSPVTSPELSQVLPENEYPSERQVVTKPAVLSYKKDDSGDDELVRELESLHKEVAPQAPSQSSKMQEETPKVTSPATDVTVKNENVKKMDDVVS